MAATPEDMMTRALVVYQNADARLPTSEVHDFMRLPCVGEYIGVGSNRNLWHRVYAVFHWTHPDATEEFEAEIRTIPVEHRKIVDAAAPLSW